MTFNYETQRVQRAMFGCAVVWLLTAAAWAAPTVKLSPALGPPTTNITVHGTGFPANVFVDVYFDSTVAAKTATSAKGDFSIATPAPATAQPGTHWVIVKVSHKGEAARKKFQIRTDFPQYGFTSASTRYNPYENTISSANVASLGMAWSFATGGAVSAPAVVAGVVYVGSSDNNVYALNADSGAMLWKYTTGGPVLSAPAVANGVVYIGSQDKNVYALNAATGTMLWSFATGNGVSFPVVVDNGVVFAESSDNSVYGLSATSGAELWNFPTGGTVYAPLAASNGVVAVVAFMSPGAFLGNYAIFALNAGDGNLLWTNALFNQIAGAPVFSDGMIVTALAGAPSVATGLAANSGNFVASYPFDYAEGGASVAVVNSQVYLWTTAYAEAVDLASGVVSWWAQGSGPTGEQAPAPPLVANGVVYLCVGSSLMALDAGNGSVLSLFATGNTVSAPAVVNGMVYMGSADSNLYALSLNGGTSASRKPSLKP